MDEASPVKLVDETSNSIPVPNVPPAPPPAPPLVPSPLVNQVSPTTISPATPPQYYTSQNTTVTTGSESHALRNIFLSALALGFILVLTSVSYVYWTFIRPRWYLATALSNLVAAESFRFRADIPLINQSTLTFEGDRFYDSSALSASKITYTAQGDLNQTVTTTVETIASESDEYLKPTNSHMTQMYNQLLSFEPYLQDDPALAAIQPVINGTSWAHYPQSSSASTTEESEYSIAPFEFFVLLAFGTKITNYEPSMQINDQDYAHYTMSLENAAIVSFLEALKDREFSIDVAELNRLIDAINQTASSNGDVLTIVVDKKLHTPHLITLTVPESIISILTENKQAEEEELISPFLSAAENPLQLLRWFPKGAIGPHIVVEFSNYNQVAPIQAPTDIVEIESVENASELLGYIITYLTNPKVNETATGKNNAYITSIHEAKLLFNQGKYAEGLTMATKSLTLAETDEDKAYANYWMGLHTYKLGKSTEAEPLLLRAAALKSAYAAPYVTLGAISTDRGNFEQMRVYSLKCVEYDPKYGWCYNNLGLSYAYLGQKAEAITQLEKAVSLDPLSFVFNDNLKRVKANQ